MDPISLAEALVRRWWLVLVLCLAGVCGAYYQATNATARYQSTVSLQLNPAARSSFLPYQADASTSSSSPVVAQAASYREVLRSRAFGQVIVDQLNLSVAPETVGGAINTQLVLNTNILRLSVTWDNALDAQQLAQRVAEVFIAENQRRQQSQPGTQAQLAEMEQSARDIQARLGPLQQQRDRLDDAVARGDLSRLQELVGLDARFTGLESSYANLLVEISRVRGSFDTAVILDNASPGQPLDALPLAQALTFGFIGSLAVAIGVVLALERAADVVRTPREIAGIAALPLLARLGHASGSRRRRDGGLVMLETPSTRVAEAIRSLRAALQLTNLSRSARTLLITSAGRGEGKTFVAANSAIALAQARHEVLLVDANLRDPALHAWFDVENTSGLADVLARVRSNSSLEPKDVRGVVATTVANLSLLPAGTLRADPGELFEAEALRRVFEILARRWDVIVIDSAHVGRYADALLLAHSVSGCVMVVRSGSTRRASLSGALAALEGIVAPVLGVVLNDERAGPLAGYRGDAAYHYGYWNRPAADLIDAGNSRHNGHAVAEAATTIESGHPGKD
jgi:succinoglycan biosynthesis transport protein ExoP